MHTSRDRPHHTLIKVPVRVGNRGREGPEKCPLGQRQFHKEARQCMMGSLRAEKVGSANFPSKAKSMVHDLLEAWSCMVEWKRVLRLANLLGG